MAWWVRAYLIFAAIQGFGIGLTGMLLPPEMQIPLRITPLNARFVAALYIAGAVGVLLAAFAKRRAEARIMVIGFAVATGLIMLVTALHWPEFMDDSLPHRPIWLFDYVADPLLGVVVIVAAGLLPERKGVVHALTPLFVVQAVVLAGLSAFLLFTPEAAAAVWPWTLPPVLGQIYGCFFLTFALGAALAARESDVGAIRTFALASLALALLVLLASLIHLDRFKPGPVTLVWFAAFAVYALASALVVVRLVSGRRFAFA